MKVHNPAEETFPKSVWKTVSLYIPQMIRFLLPGALPTRKIGYPHPTALLRPIIWSKNVCVEVLVIICGLWGSFFLYLETGGVTGQTVPSTVSE